MGLIKKKNKQQNQNIGNINNVNTSDIRLNRDDIQNFGKRRQNKDIILNLNNKYKDYESEVVFKFYEKFKAEDVKRKKTKEEKAFEKKMEKKKNKKTYNIKALTSEINGYGFNYSFQKFILTMLAAFAVLVVAGVLYGLKIPAVCALMLFAIYFMPGIISSQFKYIYEQRRFTDVVDYLEYMIYEFKKKPKIMLALRAAESSCTGEMKQRVSKAIAYIENGVYRKDLYKEAFYFIEEGYNCEHISVLHKFLIKVEAEGGEYQGSLNIILGDVKAWTERTYAFQKDKENIKGKMLVTIILALVMCLMLCFTNQKVADITENPIYQVVTSIIIIAFMFLYKKVVEILSGSWLDRKTTERKRVFQNYALALAGNPADLRRKNMPTILVCIGAGLFSLFFLEGNVAKCGLAFLFLGGFMFIKPNNDIKTAKKETIKELNREFPGWLRDLAINLQKETVQVSIKNSLKEAPLVLKPSLISLIKQLDDDPVTIKPYANYLSSFSLPDISSAMKMLYSLNAAGRDEVTSQINTLVARNNELLEKSEKQRMADSISLAGFLVAVPMIISMVKMLVDMALVLITFLRTNTA